MMENEKRKCRKKGRDKNKRIQTRFGDGLLIPEQDVYSAVLRAMNAMVLPWKPASETRCSSHTTYRRSQHPIIA